MASLGGQAESWLHRWGSQSVPEKGVVWNCPVDTSHTAKPARSPSRYTQQM